MNPVITQAIEFTNVYKKYIDAPISIREAMCHKAQYPALLPGINDGDMFAGRRLEKRIIYVGTFWWYGFPHYTPETPGEGKTGGFCFDFSAIYRIPKTDEEKKALAELGAFWKNECTTAKIQADSEGIIENTGFLTVNNYEKLIKIGLPGLKNEVEAMAESDFRTGLLMVLETIFDVCRFYIKKAEEMGRKDIANNISALIEHAPETLVQGLQLVLIYELLSHEYMYELNRLDVALGDLLAKDIDCGVITEEQAIELIHLFFKMIRENGSPWVCRLMMGGKGRYNEKNADRFIIAALKAEQRHKEVIPQMSLRVYNDMDPNILKLAYETINESYTYPTIYNDEAIISGVAEAFDVSQEEAITNYFPVGCGEFIMAYQSPAILVSGWSIPESVDAGIRACYAEKKDLTFNGLYKSAIAEIKRRAEVFARYHRLVSDKQNADCSFLIASLLTDDCIKNNKPLLGGGVRYNGSCIMAHGFTNAADSLTAIKKVVYIDKKHTLADVLKALNANFVGFENIRKSLLEAPKYGNDNEEADMMVSRLWREIGDITKEAGKSYGLDFHTVSSVNPGGLGHGFQMGATADGRLAGEAFAVGNSPTAGNDKNGLTAMLNSVQRTDPANGGSVTNIKISREFFTKEREKFEALFLTYWKNGGLQANITIINRGDLEAAIKEPQKFTHLLVRLGGWTARYIDLEPKIQQEILRRTIY